MSAETDTIEDMCRPGQCWASSLCDCEGAITGEHLATGALFGGRVRVEAERAPMFPRPVEMSIRRLQANILCEKHNGELGRTADAAAVRLLRALKQSHRPMELPGSRILRAPVRRVIRGVDFGRWLCKTHCNFIVSAGRVPSMQFVAYAFRRRPARPLHFFFAGRLGERVRLADFRDPVVHYAELLQDDTPGFEACKIGLAGFTTIVANAPLLRNRREMIDRLVDIHNDTALGPYTIHFDWAGEP